MKMSKSTKELSININDAVKNFKEFMQDGFNKIIEACKLYATIIDQSEESAEIFRKRLPEIPEGAWKRYELVGRGMLHPKLFAWRNCPGVQRLEKLSLADQEKYSRENFNVLLSNNDTMLISVHNLTHDQSRQVMNDNHVRSIPEQRAYLEDLKMRKHREIELKNSTLTIYEKPWKVTGKTSVNINGVIFKRKDIVEILSEMEG